MGSSLTAAKVRDATQPGRYRDGGGLYLNVAKGGTKSWAMRATVGGQRMDKGLGGYPRTSLSAARRMADTYRGMIAEGRNPWTKEELGRKLRAEVMGRRPNLRRGCPQSPCAQGRERRDP